MFIKRAWAYQKQSWGEIPNFVRECVSKELKSFKVNRQHKIKQILAVLSPTALHFSKKRRESGWSWYLGPCCTVAS